jgi:hypothetical protein
MNIRDFLIDPAGKDWQKLLAYWVPPLPPDATLWFVNKLGEPFLSTSDGGIHRLVLGTGDLERLAADRNTFARLLDMPANADSWLRIRLLEDCGRAGMTLVADECFGFKVPPRLFGQYVVSNLQPTNIYSHYSWLSHVARQEEIYWTGD